MAESVELATILLTDLVGSTSLAMAAGPALADELRDEHFDLLREAIVSLGGREAKNTGDGLMASFTSASAAVQCAVAMQQLFERRNRAARHEMHIRIGVSAGESTVKDGDYFGLPSIEAARLCAQAPSDGILISGLAKAIAGRCEGIEFSSVGELELKGFTEPVEALEVRWQPTLTAGVALQQRLREQPSGGFVGREAERLHLWNLWRETCAGARRLVLLGGEAGVGKTSLVTQLAQHAHVEGATVLYGRCDEDLGVPFLAWAQALDHLVREAEQTILIRYANRHGGDLQRLVPALAERVPQLPAPRQSDPETERYALYAAVHGLLQVVSGHEPLLLLLDDLHWADGPSLSLLHHVASVESSSAVMVLGTYRDDSDLSRGHPLAELLADLHREQGVERLTLAGMPADDVAAMVESAVGHKLDEGGRELALQITQETAGNPFFAGELLRHLNESGAIVQDGNGRWHLRGEIADLGLPQSVREVVGRRVASLGSDTEAVLSAASVIGRDFDLDLLQAVTELPEARVLDLLEQAEGASLLKEDRERAGSFAFAHAIIEYTLYEELGATRRARLHRRVGEVLERRAGEQAGELLGQLAYHWAEAKSPADAAKAIRYSEMAAERAVAQLAPGEAVRWYRQALDLLQQGPGEDHARRCELLIGLGEAQRQAGDPEFRRNLLEGAGLAEELGATEWLCRAVLANSRGWSSQVGAVDIKRVRALEAAAACLPPGDARRGQVLALLAAEEHYAREPSRCQTLAREAVEIARQAADVPALAETLINALLAVWVPQTFEERSSWAHELTDLASQLDDPWLRFWAAHRQTAVDIEAGDRGQVDNGMATMRTLATVLPSPPITWTRLLHESGWALVRGELEEAEWWARQALQVGLTSGQRDAPATFTMQLFHIRYYQGRLGELTEKVVGYASKISGSTIWRPSAALALVSEGRREEAIELALQEETTVVPSDGMWVAQTFACADVYWRLELRDPAARLYELLTPFSERFVQAGSTIWGSYAWALGVLASTLGESEAAEHHLVRAAELEAEFGAPLFLARTHAAHGRMLLAGGRAGDLERGQSLLEQAREAARGLGANGTGQEPAPGPRAASSSVDG